MAIVTGEAKAKVAQDQVRMIHPSRERARLL